MYGYVDVTSSTFLLPAETAPKVLMPRAHVQPAVQFCSLTVNWRLVAATDIEAWCLAYQGVLWQADPTGALAQSHGGLGSNSTRKYSTGQQADGNSCELNSDPRRCAARVHEHPCRNLVLPAPWEVGMVRTKSVNDLLTRAAVHAGGQAHLEVLHILRGRQVHHQQQRASLCHDDLHSSGCSPAARLRLRAVLGGCPDAAWQPCHADSAFGAATASHSSGHCPVQGSAASQLGR